MKRLRVTVEGKTYEVEVELIEDDESESLMPTSSYQNNQVVQNQKSEQVNIQARQTPMVSSSNGSSNEIVSPMAGNITAIIAKVGDSVNAGDKVAEMEAMKMITPLKASVAGTVKEIKVSVGDNINQGAVIAVIG